MKSISTILFICLLLIVKPTLSFAQTVIDIDGNVYHTVTIGKQVWMVENLKTTRYRNGDSIAKLGSGVKGAYCNYGDVNTYGRLYTWNITLDSRNVAPVGWHVPNDNDWSKLTIFIGGYLIAGGSLKEAGFAHWDSPNTGATNKSGFTALPGGYFVYGSFAYLGYYGVYWSTNPSPYSSNQGSCRYLTADGDSITWTSGEPGQFFSIRCIKDDTSYNYIPKIYTSNSSLNAGQTQTITGSGFTNNGTIDLYIKNSQGDLLPKNNSFTYLPNDEFTYQLPITSDMPGGEYEVYATDVTTGVTTATIKFLVNNVTAQQKLWVNEPAGGSSNQVNEPVTIQWGDFVTSGQVNGKTGLITKRYKIEYSNDNGSTWHTISSALEENAFANQVNNFTTSYIFSNAGTAYKIKVTDVDNTLNYNTSAAFTVTSIISSGSFTSSLEWDKSAPKPANHPNPYGLAADGTARVLIKLTRAADNTKPIKTINAEIKPSGNDASSSGTSLLGKILLATDIDQYSTQGNIANNTSTFVNYGTANSDQDIYFWLVAPDDFVNIKGNQDLNNQDAERTVKVNFTITYSDNTTQPITVDNVRIVRPPLMMVHGINSDATAFDKTKYDIGTGIKLFKYSGGENGLFKEYYAVNLPNYASFRDNAQILLSGGLNSFQRLINDIHYEGFAANKVDYICHSMGGDIARTIINKYPSQYYTTTDGLYRNYGKGFINKLITLNTPHNGSYLADIVADKYPGGIDEYLNPIAYTLFATTNYFNVTNGFFVPTSPTVLSVSPAIDDLQAFDGGVRFSKTQIKNHLIGSDVDEFNNTNENVILDVNYLYGAMYGVLLPLFTSVHDYIYDHYNNDEYLSNSDIVVPISSQFPSKNSADKTDIDADAYGSTNSSITYGITESHSDITDELVVGTRIMRLLNASINSSFFADDIAANPNPNGSTYKGNSITADSVINYIDTGYIQITSPQSSNVYVDSTINISLHVGDTTNLQKIQLIFQGQYYESLSKITDQIFNVQVLPTAIGKLTIVANGIYDSLGFTINHTDTATVLVAASDSLEGFYVTPKTQNLNPKQVFNPVYNAIYSTYIGNLTQDIDSLHFSIADENVVKYVDSLHEFVAQDTGTTYIVYNYKDFTDTGYVYITLTAPQTVLAVALTSFNISSNNCNTVTLNWKTSTETNNYGFDIEQSNDGIHFTKIAFIKSKGSASFSYSYTVDSLQQGQYYYRLKQIDFDGQYKYSSVQSINLNCSSKNIISLYPNPATNKITLTSSIDGLAEIKLIDTHGKTIKVFQTDFTRDNKQSLSISNLSAGIYFLEVKIGEQIQNIKFVKSN